MTPTPLPTATPLPTPSYVVQTMIEQGMIANPLPLIGVIWAVLFLFVISSLSGDRQRSQLAFLIIVLVSFPLVFLNYGVWVFSIYFFYLVYSVVSTLRRVV